MTRPVVLALAGMSALFGFAVLAPLMPVEFVGIVTIAAGGGSLLTPGVVGVLGGIALALAVGRTFCGHICPVGAVQELAYAVPVQKHVVRHPRYLEVLRAGVFAASVIAALSLVNLMAYTGVYEFFSLTISIGLAVFAGLLALSAVVYRPVCRGLCPFGLLFSLPAHVSRFPPLADGRVHQLPEVRAGLSGRRGGEGRLEARVLPLRPVHGDMPRRGGARVHRGADVKASLSSLLRFTAARSSRRPAPPLLPPRASP